MDYGAIYDEGVTSRAARLPATACPYGPGPCRASWLAGWTYEDEAAEEAGDPPAIPDDAFPWDVWTDTTDDD